MKQQKNVNLTTFKQVSWTLSLYAIWSDKQIVLPQSHTVGWATQDT